MCSNIPLCLYTFENRSSPGPDSGELSQDSRLKCKHTTPVRPRRHSNPDRYALYYMTRMTRRSVHQSGTYNRCRYPATSFLGHRSISLRTTPLSSASDGVVGVVGVVRSRSDLGPWIMPYFGAEDLLDQQQQHEIETSQLRRLLLQSNHTLQ
jgi:hypothetical protein